ncbi:recombinase family protein [Micromonospora sp. NPDC093277]|uniref:recombinase family protein n=1 Tax=Micromonospora sp. NPDC093277 TaxID=3364291 RepID=UPI00380D456F
MLNDRGLRTRMGKSWSPHTVELIITNRVYLGEKHFRDIAVTDAHPAIITTEQFDLAQRILAKRSADIGQRAANSSDYELTGKIRCPQCGRRYIGTAAHGRNHRYRYYICWSRARYGTNAGCDNHRFNADELEHAMRQAVLDFYSNGYPVISQAITEFQTSHTQSTSAYQDELAAINRQLKDNSTAVDRYLTAFEKGILDDEDDNVRTRLANLRDQSRLLRARKAQLELDLDQPPAAPAPADLSKIHARIRDVLNHGNHIARKALFEALIHEIVVNSDDSLTPIFRIPVLRDGQGPDLEGPALDQIQTADAVRALLPMVGDTGIEPVTSSV